MCRDLHSLDLSPWSTVECLGLRLIDAIVNDIHLNSARSNTRSYTLYNQGYYRVCSENGYHGLGNTDFVHMLSGLPDLLDIYVQYCTYILALGHHLDHLGLWYPPRPSDHRSAAPA